MKLRYIDALRGLAIAGVLVVHTGQHGSNELLPARLQQMILYGAFGVQLFYVISAFTLFMSLDNRHDPEPHRWRNFFIRRFFRIAPMYYVGIVYYLWQDGFGARYWLGDTDHVTGWNILSNTLFLHGFNPYWITSVVPGGWSIAVEMLFYSLLPLLFVRIRNTQQAFAFVLATLFIRAALQFVLNRYPLVGDQRLWTEYLYMYLPSQLPVFGLGILLFFVVKDNYTMRISPLLMLIAFLFLIGELAGIPLLPDHFLFALSFFLLAIALSKCEFAVFVNPVLTYLGRVSYSVYLVHFALLFWLEKAGLVDFLTPSGQWSAMVNFALRLVVVTALSALVASIFFRLVEVPLQRFGRMLIHKIDRSAESIVNAAGLVVGSAQGQQVMPARNIPGGQTHPPTNASDGK